MATSSINSITLSPDLSTLFLIDNGRAIPFDLNHKNGIVIGTLDGQLTVATALPNILTPLPDKEGEDPELPNPHKKEPIFVDDSIERLAARPRLLRLSAVKSQWTLMFIKEKAVISIIGASDIDVSIIGASDIDVSIIGASDIDVSLARKPTDTTDDEPKTTDANVQEQSRRPNCQLYSFRIAKQSINIRRVKDTLVILY